MEIHKKVRFINPHSNDIKASVTVLGSTKSALSFALKFQSQLSIETLIKTYEECLQSILDIDGVHYRYPLLDIDFTIGTTNDAQCNFHLTTEDEFWGDISLFRENKISDSEMKKIELISSLLVHPLRSVINQQANSLLSTTEVTSGVANTILVEQLVTREAKLANRERVPMSLILIDIDRFHKITEHSNFTIRDDILYSVMNVMRTNIRETDLLFRYIKNTYCLLLKGVSVNNAYEISERIRNAINNHKFITAKNKNTHITVSAGISELLSTDSIESIFDRANHALQHAKKLGRNQSIVSDGKFIN